MSADNGIYILRTKRNFKKEGKGFVKSPDYYVYRVAHAQAIDNFDWYTNNQFYNLGFYMHCIWKKSPVFEKPEDATLYAHKLAKEHEVLEYGVSNIDTEYFFPEDF